MKFTSHSATHVGMVRKLNEDSMVERTDIGVWAVADGMGGHEAGDYASRMVVEYIEAMKPCEDFDLLVESVRSSLEQANRQLLDESSGYDSQRVPGSTAVVLAIKGEDGAVFWIGDSRVYRQRDGQLEQLTRDHSHVQDLIDLNMLRPEDAESHPMANAITRAMGIAEPLELDIKMVDVLAGDQFLLCSDGLSRLVSNDEITSILRDNSGEEIVQSLLHTALVRGAPDNVTLIHVGEEPVGSDAVNLDDEPTLEQEKFDR